MIVFLQAWLEGRVVSRAMAARLLERPYPMFDTGTYYGLGLMLYDVPDGPGRLYWIGHSGGAPGVNAVVAWSPQDRAFVAAAVTGQGASAAFANAALKAYRRAYPAP
jgi:D-alanyl-D-alanine carboxypeptidase